jgi:acyl-CoA synthetase (AMP-forming)/AMP-acid ligase II
MSTFCDLLKQAGRQEPDRLAVTLLHSGKEDVPLTVRQLLLGAEGVAQALQARGIQPGEVVVLILQHGQDLVYSFFGAILGGMVPSIMPFLTEKLLPERYRADLAALVEVTRPAAIVTYPEFREEVEAALGSGSSVRVVLLTSEIHPADTVDDSTWAGLDRSGEDIVLLQHSSGTTGLQKGVALSHQAVLNQLESYRKALDINKQDVVVSWLPLYHDMGLIAGFIMPLLSGIPLVLMSPFEWVRAPYRLFQAVSRFGGTLTWLPNFAYNFCAQKVRDRDLQGVNLSTWRAVINCSEPTRWESHQEFIQRFQPYGLRPETLVTCYAMAENVFAVTQSGIHEPVQVDDIDLEALQTEKIARPASGDRIPFKMVSAGQPLEHVQVRVLDEKGRELPERHLGEIALHSHCMLSGYYHREDATQKAFHDGWYLTGDLGYLADGELYVSGRKKDLIIVGGKNIYPQDLERLASRVPGVHPGRVAAFGVFNQEQGTEEVVVVAEAETTATEEMERLADAIRQEVTRGSAVALRHVQVVGPHWIIKTSSGKTARAANREKFLKEFGDQ